MTELFTVLRREIIYIWYYFEIQFRQIFWYWILGMLIGSFISVFAKDTINGIFAGMKDKKLGLFGIIPALFLVHFITDDPNSNMPRNTDCHSCKIRQNRRVFRRP